MSGVAPVCPSSPADVPAFLQQSGANDAPLKGPLLARHHSEAHRRPAAGRREEAEDRVEEGGGRGAAWTDALLTPGSPHREGRQSKENWLPKEGPSHSPLWRPSWLTQPCAVTPSTPLRYEQSMTPSTTQLQRGMACGPPMPRCQRGAKRAPQKEHGRVGGEKSPSVHKHTSVQ